MTYDRDNARRASTPMPSINSLRDGGSRHAWPSPITTGATTTMPIPSDRNHVCQASQNGAALCSKVIVAAPPVAEVAVARPAAARKPPTRPRSPNVNGQPNHRSSSQATRTASPALQKPLNTDVARLLSLIRLAATVPTTTPMTSAGRARGPNVIKIPAARPDAGQNTATSEPAVSKARPRRAARKYPIATTPAAPSTDIHSPAGVSRYVSALWGARPVFKAPPT